MGNFSKGVRSESVNVGAKWPERNNLVDAQSLKRRPPLRSGFCSCGMAKAPSTATGVSFNNPRRLMVLNWQLSIREFIKCVPCWRQNSSDEIREYEKSSKAILDITYQGMSGNRAHVKDREYLRNESENAQFEIGSNQWDCMIFRSCHLGRINPPTSEVR